MSHSQRMSAARERANLAPRRLVVHALQPTQLDDARIRCLALRFRALVDVLHEDKGAGCASAQARRECEDGLPACACAPGNGRWCVAASGAARAGVGATHLSEGQDRHRGRVRWGATADRHPPVCGGETAIAVY
jgi:hypothetical protein